jgi:glycosyltransferase involved in cell wall biosynthesis
MLEAMACGSLFVGAATGGIRDHICDDINGYLFPPLDANKLAHIVQQVFGNRAKMQQLQMASLDYVQTHLAWNIIVRRFRKVVEEKVLVSRKVITT